MSDGVVLLQHMLYGLQQGGRQRSLWLIGVLLQSTGVEQSKADLCMFRKVVDREVTSITLTHTNNEPPRMDPD